MKIELHKISIRELTEGYSNNSEDGVVGYGGRLNIRPPYQREFIYKPKQQEAVIETVKKGFPLNVMYWVNGEDDNYELLDGQQRTLSICDYVHGNYSVDYQYFHNLNPEEQDVILDYEIMIYFCEGDNSAKLDWFKTINIAGEKLTTQELRNAMYIGPWLHDAKRHFSRSGCPAHDIGSDYLKGSSIRQDYLETALKWISYGDVEGYMATHQHDQNANELWIYFQSVINWVELTFPNYRKSMKGVDWGALFNSYGADILDTVELNKQIVSLMINEDVTKKSGIYTYILTRDERFLNIRQFTPNQKMEAYERQNGVCVVCGKLTDYDQTEADHITPFAEGGKTVADNCQILCRKCNRTKSDK